MKAAQISQAGGDFEIVERDKPIPGEDQVLIKVEACGICHSDMFVKEGAFPGIEYPRIPGHEVIGIIEKVGKRVHRWKEGQRVGVGWHGGHCFECDPCRRGDFINCENAKITGISYDGGYAEYMTAPANAIASVPESLDSVKAAPLLCAGITTYNALRHTHARSGDVVAVQGIGGLGHLGVQYAKQMGFVTVAISGSNDKQDLAMELGADHFVAANEEDPAEALQKLGGAKVILATAPNSEVISPLVGGLAIDGQLLVVAATNDPLEITPFSLIAARKLVSGWPSGTAIDSEDTLKFSAKSGAMPMIETYSLNQVNEAYAQMISNKAKFRVVLTMN